VTLCLFFHNQVDVLDLIQCMRVCACMWVCMRVCGVCAAMSLSIQDMHLKSLHRPNLAAMSLSIQDMHLCVSAPMRLCAYGSVRLSVYLAFLMMSYRPWRRSPVFPAKALTTKALTTLILCGSLMQTACFSLSAASAALNGAHAESYSCCQVFMIGSFLTS
jgi:hypothetical protein